MHVMECTYYLIISVYVQASLWGVTQQGNSCYCYESAYLLEYFSNACAHLFKGLRGKLIFT